LIVASFALIAASAAHAGPLGVNVGANAGAGINGIAGSIGGSAALHGPVFTGGASAAAVHAGPNAPIMGASSTSVGLARAGAAMSASSGGVVYPDVVVDKSDYETIGMRADRVSTEATSTTKASVDHEHGIAGAIVASDDRVAVQAREATAARLVTSEQIRAASPQERSRVVGAVSASMADDVKFMAHAKRDAKEWSEAQRADFKVAANESATRAKVVKKDIKVAEKASERDWAQARAQLATDYAAYAQASDRARAIASASSSASANGQGEASAHTPTAKANAAAAAESHAATQARL
jgi:hypothetical protein